MNKKINNLVPLVLIAAVIVFFIIVIFACSTKWTEYNEAKSKAQKNSMERQKLESQVKQAESEQQSEALKLKSIKTVYETDISSSNDNLGIFGKMFEDIIKKAQQNGLLIRSIEYEMSPDSDPLYMENSDSYNVCKLKFFFVGSYSQLNSFLSDMYRNFEYLVYFSSINVTAFSSNTDYLLINQAITLYSKKPEQKNKRQEAPLGRKK